MRSDGNIAGDRLRIGELEIDTGAGELLRAGAAVDVEPQVFSLIAYLAARPGALVSRDELIEAVWGGRIVSDSAIASRINAARAALGDDGKAQRIIKTVPRRGFRFTASAPVTTISEKPSIAVLPFDNLSGDPEQRYFSDGITDDIITDLSRYNEITVIARHSSFAWRDRTADVREIAEDLGVEYILEGSVRRAGPRVRVTVQLADVRGGHQVWTERYDRDLSDIFAVQDEITGLIVNTLIGQVTRQHYRRALAKGAEGANAYDHAARAMEFVWQHGREAVQTARGEAERAIALDPGFARAYSILSWTHISEASNQWSDDPNSSFRKALSAARAALEADDREPFAHLPLGWSQIWLERDHPAGLSSLRRAVDLNPSSAHFHSMLGWGLGWSGEPEAALSELEHAMRLSPRYPSLYLIFVARALYHLERFEEAVSHLEDHITAMPEHSNAMALAAACFAGLEQWDKARTMVERIGALETGYGLGFVRESMPFALESDRALYLDRLRAAGLPE